MSRNCSTEAYLYLEARKPGLFHSHICDALANNGVVHAAPDCFICAVPAKDNPQHLIILFQCSELPALWQLAHMYRHRYTHIRFRRDFKNGYSERTVPLDAIIRKTSLVNALATSHA